MLSSCRREFGVITIVSNSGWSPFYINNYHDDASGDDNVNDNDEDGEVINTTQQCQSLDGQKKALSKLVKRK